MRAQEDVEPPTRLPHLDPTMSRSRLTLLSHLSRFISLCILVRIVRGQNVVAVDCIAGATMVGISIFYVKDTTNSTAIVLQFQRTDPLSCSSVFDVAMLRWAYVKEVTPV